MKNISLLFTIAIVSMAMNSAAQETGTFSDTRDGKIYKTVKIANQIWMAENLAYKASNGCWAYINDQSNVAIYGYLYNFETAKKVCPSGWHLPSDDEWRTLTNYLGGATIAGGKMKDTKLWDSPNIDATNESGFTGLPGGSLNSSGIFNYMSYNSFWWSSTEFNESYTLICYLSCGNGIANQLEFLNMEAAVSVRCLKDKPEP